MLHVLTTSVALQTQSTTFLGLSPVVQDLSVEKKSKQVIDQDDHVCAVLKSSQPSSSVQEGTLRLF